MGNDLYTFRDILWALSIIKRRVDEFNKSDCGVTIDGYIGTAMIVKGIDKVADFFGYEVEGGDFLKHLKLFDVEIMERVDEVIRDTE